jgi:hypothetical protein
MRIEVRIYGISMLVKRLRALLRTLMIRSAPCRLDRQEGEDRPTKPRGTSSPVYYIGPQIDHGDPNSTMRVTISSALRHGIALNGIAYVCHIFNVSRDDFV